MANAEAGKTALILTGGGARAAYQVGVLKAIRSLLPEPGRNPFPILCGTSAGAINAALLAVAILGNSRPELRRKLKEFRDEQTKKVMGDELK